MASWHHQTGKGDGGGGGGTRDVRRTLFSSSGIDTRNRRLVFKTEVALACSNYCLPGIKFEVLRVPGENCARYYLGPSNIRERSERKLLRIKYS